MGTDMKPMQWLAGVEVSDGIAIGQAQLLAASVVVEHRSVSHEQGPH